MKARERPSAGVFDPHRVITLPDGGVHFAEAEEAMATLRPPLEVLLGHDVADEVFGQLPKDW